MWLNCGILLFIQLGNFLAQESTTDDDDETLSREPRITLQPFDIYGRSGSPAALVCREAEGDPLPLITWYQNGGPVETTKDNPLSNRILLEESPNRIKLFFQTVIHNKRKKPDIGVYYCNATNVHGSAISRAAKVSIFTSGIILEPTTATWDEARQSCDARMFTLVPGRRYRAKKLLNTLTEGQTLWLRGWRAVTDFTKDADGKVKSLKVDVSRNIKKGIPFVCESGPGVYTIPGGSASSKNEAADACTNQGYSLAMFDKEDYITAAFDVMTQDKPYWIGDVISKETVAKLCLAATIKKGKLLYIYDTCTKQHNYACLTDQDAINSFHYVVSFKMSIYKDFEKEIEEKKALTTSSTLPPVTTTTTPQTTTTLPTTTTTMPTTTTSTFTLPPTTSTSPTTTSTTTQTTSTSQTTSTASSTTSTTMSTTSTTLSSTSSSSPTAAIFLPDITTEQEETSTSSTTETATSEVSSTTPILVPLTDIFIFANTTDHAMTDAPMTPMKVNVTGMTTEDGPLATTEMDMGETTDPSMKDAVSSTAVNADVTGMTTKNGSMATTEMDIGVVGVKSDITTENEMERTSDSKESSTDSMLTTDAGGIVILSGLTEKPVTVSSTMKAKMTTDMANATVEITTSGKNAERTSSDPSMKSGDILDQHIKEILSKSSYNTKPSTTHKTLVSSISSLNIPTKSLEDDKTQSTTIVLIELDSDKTESQYTVNNDDKQDKGVNMPGGEDITGDTGETNVAESTNKKDDSVPKDAWELPLIIAFVIMAIAVLVALALAFYLHRKRKTQKSKDITKEPDVEMRPNPPVNGDKKERETATFKDAAYDI